MARPDTLEPEAPYYWESCAPEDRQRMESAVLELCDRAAASTAKRDRAAQLAEEQRARDAEAVRDLPPMQLPAVDEAAQERFLSRALSDLNKLADVMRARRCAPSTILLALARQAIFWALRALVEGIELAGDSAEWRRRTRTFAAWLLKHDGVYSAECAVRAAERDFAEGLGGSK